MRITNPSGPRRLTEGKAAARSERSGGPAFAPSPPAARATGSACSAAGVASLASLSTILSVQAVDDALEGRRRARRYGEALMDELDSLRTALLEGVLPAESLPRLRRLVGSERPGSDDPALAAVLDAIELRVEVELAKLERAAGGR